MEGEGGVAASFISSLAMLDTNDLPIADLEKGKGGREMGHAPGPPPHRRQRRWRGVPTLASIKGEGNW